jgi:uncharacterized protein
LVVSGSGECMFQFVAGLCDVLWNGKYVVGVCAVKRHLVFLAWSPRVIEAFKVRLGKFVVGKVSFQIPVDWEIGRDLVKDLVRARLAELD